MNSHDRVIDPKYCIDGTNIPRACTTKETAKAFHVTVHTILRWASNGKGPVKPVRTEPGHPLLWLEVDIVEALLGK